MLDAVVVQELSLSSDGALVRDIPSIHQGGFPLELQVREQFNSWQADSGTNSHSDNWDPQPQLWEDLFSSTTASQAEWPVI